MADKYEHINLDEDQSGGTHNPIQDGRTVTIDHTVTEFKVVVRTTCSGVGPDRIKDLIQQKFEVVKCEMVSGQRYVRPVWTPFRRPASKAEVKAIREHHAGSDEPVN